MLTEKDHLQLQRKQIEESEIVKQLEIFKKGIPFVNLKESATTGNGIIAFSEEQMQEYSNLYEFEIDRLSVLKFVPASGAASRMFKSLFFFIEDYDYKKETLEQYLERLQMADLRNFFSNLKKFPFYNEVVALLKNDGLEFANPKDGYQAVCFVNKILGAEGLNYAAMPKGLLPFHDYTTSKASAFEEHLKEAVLYGASCGRAQLHFTISEAHKTKFESALQRVRKDFKNHEDVAFEVSFSFQKQKTDTVAVTPENELFRNSYGELVFRPSGHGALIENLNEQDADLIFIKNIDNVVAEKFQEQTAFYKKVLAGKCLEVQKKAFKFARELDSFPNEVKINEVFDFLTSDLNVRIPENIIESDTGVQIDFLKSTLNRPIRVCGMVKNEGEPGGGPFWVKNDKEQVALQIVESAQINKADKSQLKLLNSSTHFNPVDLVCAVKNYKGEKYNLLDFVDTKMGFITSKTFEGKQIKGLELPGLWNGAMAYWNTIFVEVPLTTFNPVKTLTDLLKGSHQA